MGLLPDWLRRANWAYRIGDWAGEFANDVTSKLLVEVRVEMYTDTTLPPHAMECFLHFAVDRSLEPATFDRRADLDGLAQEVGEAFDAHWAGAGGQLLVLARIIETSSEASQDSTDRGVWVARAGTAEPSICPREVALCLSYYAGVNLAGMRGRVFLPVAYAGVTTLGRPPEALMFDALSLGGALADVGGTGTQWSIYSRTQGLAFSITDSYVDNEWDTQRSRGLSSTARVMAQHGESEVS